MMKLTRANYYSAEADKEYVSYSQLKAFAQCETRCLADINREIEREQSTSMLVGSYVDAYLDGEKAFGEFKVGHPELFKRDGTLKSDFVFADEIIARINSDTVFRGLLRGRRQVIMTGTVMGVPVKIRIDSLHKDKIVDGKVMKDLADIWDEEAGMYVPWWRYYHYDWQAWLYQTVVAQNKGVVLPFVNAVATREKGIDIRAFMYSEETLRNAGEEIKAIIRDLQAAKNGVKATISCGHCDYCRAHRVVKRGEYEKI